MFKIKVLALSLLGLLLICPKANASEKRPSNIFNVAIIQSPVVPGAPVGIQWDEDDSALNADAIVVFNFCVDNTCSAVPVAAKVASSAGVSTFQVAFPTLTEGAHTLTVQSCNTDLCSNPIPLVLRVPKAPRGLRKR